MIKKHQDAFNKAYVNTIRSKKKVFHYNKKTKTNESMVPLSEILKNFKKFINVVEKDLKIGKYAKKQVRK